MSLQSSPFQLQRNPIIEAVYKRDFAKLQALIAEGTEVDNPGPNGVTALLYAVNEGLKPFVELLIEHGANINASSSTLNNPLVVAVSKKYLDIARYLIDKGADIHWKDNLGRTALFYTVIPEEQPELMTTLLACGADVNLRDGKLLTPLWYARFYRYQHAEELLRAAGGTT